MLTSALEALINGTIEKPNQIVVVNGGDKRADQVVRRFQGLYNIDLQLVNTVNYNSAASRNIGLPYCTGDIVAMTDDDAEVAPDWVIQMKRAHSEHPEAGAIGGSVIGAHSKESVLSRIADCVTYPTSPRPGYVSNLPEVNISYKSMMIKLLGPQDQTLFRGEDIDYNWRLKHMGYPIYYDPSIKVKHHHRSTLKGFLNQFYMYGRAYILVRRKWPDMYCVYPHGLHRPKDILKGIYFFLAVLYEPFVSAMRLRRWPDRIRAIPVLMITHVLWKTGMIVQGFQNRISRHGNRQN